MVDRKAENDTDPTAMVVDERAPDAVTDPCGPPAGAQDDEDAATERLGEEEDDDLDEEEGWRIMRAWEFAAAGWRRRRGLVHAAESEGRDYVAYEGGGPAARAARGRWRDPAAKVLVGEDVGGERAATTALIGRPPRSWIWWTAGGAAAVVLCGGLVASMSKGAHRAASDQRLSTVIPQPSAVVAQSASTERRVVPAVQVPAPSIAMPEEPRARTSSSSASVATASGSSAASSRRRAIAAPAKGTPVEAASSREEPGFAATQHF